MYNLFDWWGDLDWRVIKPSYIFRPNQINIIKMENSKLQMDVASLTVYMAYYMGTCLYYTLPNYFEGKKSFSFLGCIYNQEMHKKMF